MTANKFLVAVGCQRAGAKQCQWGRHFSLSKFHSSLSNLLRSSWGTYRIVSHNPYMAPTQVRASQLPVPMKRIYGDLLTYL